MTSSSLLLLLDPSVGVRARPLGGADVTHGPSQGHVGLIEASSTCELESAQENRTTNVTRAEWTGGKGGVGGWTVEIEESYTDGST